MKRILPSLLAIVGLGTCALGQHDTSLDGAVVPELGSGQYEMLNIDMLDLAGQETLEDLKAVISGKFGYENDKDQFYSYYTETNWTPKATIVLTQAQMVQYVLEGDTLSGPDWINVTGLGVRYHCKTAFHAWQSEPCP